MAQVPLLQLAHSQREAAYHEAGHAVIEMLYGFTPQLVVLWTQDGQWEGECYSCALSEKGNGAWLAEKAVAGVLSQAKHLAERHLAHEMLLEQRSVTDGFVRFLLQPPALSGSCQILLASVSGATACRVDIGGCYSSPDYQHFRTAVAQLARSTGAGSQFIGNEPECTPFAREHLVNCINHLNDQLVWEKVGELAKPCCSPPTLSPSAFVESR